MHKCKILTLQFLKILSPKLILKLYEIKNDFIVLGFYSKKTGNDFKMTPLARMEKVYLQKLLINIIVLCGMLWTDKR